MTAATMAKEELLIERAKILAEQARGTFSPHHARVLKRKLAEVERQLSELGVRF